MKTLEIGEQESKEGEQGFCSSATAYQCHISKIPQSAIVSKFGAPANVFGHKQRPACTKQRWRVRWTRTPASRCFLGQSRYLDRQRR